MATVPVVVYGGGGIFTEYFNAIAVAVGGKDFSALLRISVLLAGTTAIFSAVFRRDFLICIKWFATYYLVFYIMFLPKVSVEIIDRTDSGHVYHIDNVPLGLGLLASVTTTIGDSLTKLTDKVFSMPDDLRYSKTGMMMASKLVLSSRQFQINDSILNENMRQFVTHCVFWDLLLNHYTLDDLTQAPNIWQFVAERASPARAFIYNKTVTICKEGATKLTVDLKNSLDKVASYQGSKIFSSAKTPTDAKKLLLKYLPISYGYLLKTSSDATDILQQSIMSNAIIDGTLHFGIEANSQTAVASYTAAKAQEQQRLTQNTLGCLAGYWLPIMKNAFEAIMYGCFIFVVLLSIFPFGLHVLKNYVYTLCWLQAWAPLYAVINLICSYYAKVQSLGEAQQGFILRDISGFMQVNHDMASLAGYLTLSVPFIAAGLVRGMAGTMTHVAQYLGGVSQSVGSQAASEAVAGNISMGTTSMRNNSAFNFSAYQQDLTARMSSGVSYQLPSGESINFMPDGGITVNRRGAISDLGVDINLVGSIHNSAMEQADRSYNAAKSEAVASSENYTAAMRNLYELAEHSGSSKSSGDSWVTSESSSAVQALHKTKDLTQQFANEHNLTYQHAKELLTNAHGGLGISGEISGKAGTLGGDVVGSGASLGGKVSAAMGIDGSSSQKDLSTEQRLYSAAESFTKRSGYSESVDLISRAAKEQSFHSSNEQGAKLVDSMAGSFEKSSSLKKESDAHFQEAASYRHVASQAKEDAVNINVNASQDFLKYISNSPDHSGRGRMGIMTALGHLQNPETAKAFADNFARNYAGAHLSNWGVGMERSQQRIKQAYQNNAESIANQANIDLQKQQATNEEQIKTLADKKELTKENLVDTVTKANAETQLKTNKSDIQQERNRVDSSDLVKEQKFMLERDKAKQARENGVLYDVFHRQEIRTEIKNKIDENS